MGLDMYLTAKKFIFDDEDRIRLREAIGKVYPEIELKPEEISFEVMYWRKANAIHLWFVKNVQNGVDDCGNYYVSEENLRKLLDVVKEVLRNREKAQELLPTQEGFFFGGVEYDEYYFKDLEETEIKIQEILDNELYKIFDFEYHSSW